MDQHHSTANRQAIVAAKRYMHRFAWPTVLLTALVIGGFALNLALYLAGLTPWWLATLIYAAFTYLAYTPLHEACHGNIHGDRQALRWLNALCGYLMAPIIMIPYASHRIEHFTHHRYTNQAGKDPDAMLSEMSAGFSAFVATGLRFLWLQNTYIFRHYWRQSPWTQRCIYCLELAFSLGWRVLLVTWTNDMGLLPMLVLGYLLGAFFTTYWFAYRPHHPYRETARYRNTNTLIMPPWMKPLEWFWLGQNLHAIHHLFPRVPFYCYHALYRDIAPIMRAENAPIVGIFSRKAVVN